MLVVTICVLLAFESALTPGHLMSDVLIGPLSSCKLLLKVSFMEPFPLTFGLSLFLPPSIFPSILVFSKEA